MAEWGYANTGAGDEGGVAGDGERAGELGEQQAVTAAGDDGEEQPEGAEPHAGEKRMHPRSSQRGADDNGKEHGDEEIRNNHAGSKKKRGRKNKKPGDQRNGA